MFRDGKAVGQIMGFMPKQILKSKIDALLKS
jgi:hypothetical protein